MFDHLFTEAIGEAQELGALRTALLDVLFDQMPIGIAVVDRGMTVLRVNAMWCAFLQRYAPLNSPRIVAGMNLFDAFPTERERFTPSLEEALNGRVMRHEAIPMQRDSVLSYWDVVVTPLRQDGEIKSLLIVVTDASDRVFANRLLEEKEAQYRGIFEATSEGVIILNTDGMIVEANPAACAMYGYSYDEIIGLSSSELIHSDRLPQVLSQVFSGQDADLHSVNYRRGGSGFDVEVRATLFAYRGEPHILAVIRDVTERVRAYQILEQRVEERTRELSTLLKASNNITSTLALEPLLNRILDELQSVIAYHGAAIFTLRGEDLLGLLIYRGPIPQDSLHRNWSVPGDPLFGEVIRTHQPVIVPDVSDDTALARAFQKVVGENLRFRRSWMGVPLIVRQRVIGMLAFDSEIPGYFSPHLASLALAIANHAAVAMDNSRLYKQEQERRQETERRRLVAEGLRDILNIINSNRSLNEILEFIVKQAGRLLGTDSIAIFDYQSEAERLVVQTAIGLDDDLLKGFEIKAGRGIIGRAFVERKSANVTDLTTIHLAQDDPQRPVVERWAQRFKSLLAVPMMSRDELYGEMVLYYPQQHEFTEEEIQLVVAVCDQAALAIENARLRAQAEQAAVAAERSRLARELHDAVTQTLFSASLIAEVLPRLWDRDREEGLRRLADLRQLTRGALAEMRTLLLELRPATLTEADLRDLLRQLCEALTGRARIPVHLHVEGEPRVLPPDVQIAFYRIAQESLNNVFKHAEATEVDVRLEFRPECVCLTVTDNGRGFNPGNVTAENLGLRIMRERADGIGATYQLINLTNGGTRVSLEWSAGEGQ